jgi:hypothetical protein
MTESGSLVADQFVSRSGAEYPSEGSLFFLDRPITDSYDNVSKVVYNMHVTVRTLQMRQQQSLPLGQCLDEIFKIVRDGLNLLVECVG